MVTTGYREWVARPEKEAKTPMARWVRGIRHAAGLSQRKFAEAIGVEWVGTISRWETGDQKVEIDSMTLILRAFPDSPPPPVAGMSDLDRSVAPATMNQGTANVELTDGAIVARDVDSEPREIRARLRNAALLAIQEEKKRIAEEARRNPTELDADRKARPRPGKVSSGLVKTRT